jgi:hypothetical protein
LVFALPNIINLHHKLTFQYQENSSLRTHNRNFKTCTAIFPGQPPSENGAYLPTYQVNGLLSAGRSLAQTIRHRSLRHLLQLECQGLHKGLHGLGRSLQSHLVTWPRMLWDAWPRRA